MKKYYLNKDYSVYGESLVTLEDKIEVPFPPHSNCIWDVDGDKWVDAPIEVQE
jgi:hypothetical protein